MIATATRDTYAYAFEAERVREYPAIDAFEREMGYRIDRATLEAAARVLACPVKANPPNWQHGRVLYAAARKYMEGKPSGCWSLLDIGTAKGFSALCLQWALNDHAGGALTNGVTSVDVIDPTVRALRNTCVETDGLKTLAETLAPWPESEAIAFYRATGLQWLAEHDSRVNVAFIDGKHTGAVVRAEGELLAMRQHAGDLAIFDDLQIDGVAEAVRRLVRFYDVRRLQVHDGRAYGIGVRR